MSAGRPARSSGVACHGLMKPAEGLLDAGLEVAGRLGAVLDCRGWVDRWLGQPCPGLVGDGAGLVALGQWKQASGLDAGRRPWRPSWVAVRAGGRAGAEIRGDVEAPAWPLYLGLLPGRVDLRVP